MSKLEEAAGAQLFERTPFRLTPAGAVLFAHVEPFFANLGPLRAELRAGAEPELRFGELHFTADLILGLFPHVKAGKDLAIAGGHPGQNIANELHLLAEHHLPPKILLMNFVKEGIKSND